MSARQFPPVSSEKCVTEKMDSNRDRIAFVFLSSANILGVGRLGFTSLFFFFFTLSFLFFNRPSLQIVVLEKILHVQSEPGKFSPSCGPVCFYGVLRG